MERTDKNSNRRTEVKRTKNPDRATGKGKASNGKRTKRKNTKRKNTVGTLLACIVAMAAFLTVLGVIVFSSDRAPGKDNVLSGESELLSTVSADEMGFPVTFSNNDIIRVESFSSRIFVLGKKILTCISDRGKVKFNQIFTFTNPEMTVCDKYGVVYDRASSKYFVFDEKGLVYEGVSENGKHIITAAINNRGEVAFVTKSDDSACHVSLADKTGEIVYAWACGEEYGVSLDVSPDGKEIICGAIGSEDGNIYSAIYRINTHTKDEPVGYKIDGSAVIDVELQGKKAVVTFNNKREIFTFRSNSTDRQEVSLPTGITLCYSDKNANTVVVSKKVGTFDTSEITVYNKSNRISYVGFYEGKISDVICRGKKVYILTDSSICESQSDGSFEAVGSKEINGKGFVICKNRLYYYSTGHVDINS